MSNSTIDPFFKPEDWGLVTKNFSFIWEDLAAFHEKYSGIKLEDRSKEDIVEEITENLAPAKYLQQLIAFATAAEHIYNWDSVNSDDRAREHLETFLDIGLSVLSTIPSIGAAISMTRVGSSNPIMEVVEAIRRAIQSPPSISEDIPREAIKLVSKDLAKIAQKLIDRQALITAVAEAGVETEENIANLFDTVKTGRALTWKTIFAEIILTVPEDTLGEPIARTRKRLLGKFAELSTASLDNIHSNFPDIAEAVDRDNSLLEPIKKLVAELFNGESLDPQKVSEVLRPGTKGKSKANILYRVFDEVVSKASQSLINTRLNIESAVSNIVEHASYKESLQKMQVFLDELEVVNAALKSEIDILDQMEGFTTDLQTYYKISDDKEKFIEEQNLLDKQRLDLQKRIEFINNFPPLSSTTTERKRKLDDLKAQLAAVKKNLQAVRGELQIHDDIASQPDVFEGAVKTYLQEMADQASYHWLSSSVKEVLNKGTAQEALSQLNILRARLGATLDLTKKQHQNVREQRGKYLAAQSINKAVDTVLSQPLINETGRQEVDKIEFSKQLEQVFTNYLEGVQLLSSTDGGETDSDEIDSAAERYRQIQEQLVQAEEDNEEPITVREAIVGEEDVKKIAQKVASKHITRQKLNREKVIYQRDYKKLLGAKVKADIAVEKTKQVLENSEGLKELGVQEHKYHIGALEKAIDYGIRLIAAAKASLHNQHDQHFVDRIKRIFPLAQDNWGDTNSFVVKQLQKDIAELEKRKKKVDKIIEDAIPYSEKRLRNMKQAADKKWSEEFELASTAKYLKETELGEIPLRLGKLKGLKDLLSNASTATVLTEQLEEDVDNWLSEYFQVREKYISILESNAKEEVLGIRNRQDLTDGALDTCKQYLECIENLLESSKLFDNNELDVLNFVYKGAFLEEEIIPLESDVINYRERLHFLRKHDSRVKQTPDDQKALNKDIAKAEAKLNETQDKLDKFKKERILEPVKGGNDNLPNGTLLTELRELYAVLRKPNFISQATSLSKGDLENIKGDLQRLVTELSSKQEELVDHNDELSQSISKTEKALTDAQTVVKKFQAELDIHHQVYLPVANNESSATVFVNLLRNKFADQDEEIQVRYQPRAVVEHALRQLVGGKRNKPAGAILKGYLEGFTGYKGAGFQGFGGYQGLKFAILDYIVDPRKEGNVIKHYYEKGEDTYDYKNEGNVEGGFQNTIHQLFSYGEPVDAEKISAGLGATLFKLFGDAGYFTVQRVPNQDHPNIDQINELDQQLNETEDSAFWEESFGTKLPNNQIADGAEPVTTLTRVIDVSDVTGDSINFSFDWLFKGEKITSKALILNVRNAATGSYIHTANLRSDGTNEWQHYDQLLGNVSSFKGFGEEEVEQLEIFFEIKAGHAGYLDNLALSGTTTVVKSSRRQNLQQQRESLLASSKEQSWRIQYDAELNDDERRWVTQLLADVGLKEGDNPVKDLMTNGVLNLLDPQLFYLDNLPDGIINKNTAKIKHESIISAIQKKSGESGLAHQVELMLDEMGKGDGKLRTDYSIFRDWLVALALDPVADLSEDFAKAGIDVTTALDNFSMQFQPLFEAISKKQGKVDFRLESKGLVISL